MKTLEQVSQTQLMMFTCIYIYSSNTAYLINPIINSGQYSSWMSLLLAALIAFLFIYLMIYVCERCPKKSFLEHGDKIVTRWIHMIFLLYMGFYFFHSASIHVRLFQNFITQTYLSTTPNLVIAGVIFLLATVIVWLGLESIFRFSELFFFLTLALGVLTPFLVAKELDFDMLIAFVKHFNIAQIAGTTMYTVPWYTDIIVIMLFYGMIDDSKKSLKSIVIGIGFSVSILLPILLAYIMLFSPYYGADITYPMLEVLRHLRIGDFIENLDPVLIAIWMSGICVKFGICLYAATLIAAKLFRIVNYRLLVIPVGIFMFGYSTHLDRNATEIYNFITQAWTGFGWTVTFIPLIYFIVLKIKAMKQKQTHLSQSG